MTPTNPLPLICACAWCLPRVELDALNRRYPGQVTHGICPACVVKLEAGATS